MGSDLPEGGEVMRIPPSDDVRFHSIMQATQQDDDPYEPDPWLGWAAFFCGVGLVLLTWISWVVLG